MQDSYSLLCSPLHYPHLILKMQKCEITYLEFTATSKGHQSATMLFFL